VLLEFDADQRLWQETVRDAVAKQCPPTLVRSIAEDGVDPSPLWKTYVDAGWTELTDPENAVELAIVLEELGRATDPTPFLATLTQFAPLAGDRFDSQQAGTAVYGGVTAHRDADGKAADPGLPSVQGEGKSVARRLEQPHIATRILRNEVANEISGI